MSKPFVLTYTPDGHEAREAGFLTRRNAVDLAELYARKGYGAVGVFAVQPDGEYVQIWPAIAPVIAVEVIVADSVAKRAPARRAAR